MDQLRQEVLQRHPTNHQSRKNLNLDLKLEKIASWLCNLWRFRQSIQSFQSKTVQFPLHLPSILLPSPIVTPPNSIIQTPPPHPRPLNKTNTIVNKWIKIAKSSHEKSKTESLELWSTQEQWAICFVYLGWGLRRSQRKEVKPWTLEKRTTKSWNYEKRLRFAQRLRKLTKCICWWLQMIESIQWTKKKL
jgi:hypothetical protein